MHGVDLDLTYVTKQIIAMSFPSRGTLSWYRNSIREVAAFLNEKYGDNYKVYNLCSERVYDADRSVCLSVPLISSVPIHGSRNLELSSND